MLGTPRAMRNHSDTTSLADITDATAREREREGVREGERDREREYINTM